MVEEKTQAIAFVEQLQILYFERRDMTAVLEAMDEDICWIGTGGHELCQGIAQARALLSAQKQECPVPFVVSSHHYHVQCLSERLFVVYGQLSAHCTDEHFAPIHVRITAVCKAQNGHMKLTNLHMSCPDIDQGRAHFFARQSDAKHRYEMAERVSESELTLRIREQELAALTQNIPGGAHQCLTDQALTLVSVSDSFLQLFGYTQEELAHKFHRSLMQMIYPDDRAAMWQSLQAQLQNGNDVELEYRIVRKGGQLLWILDHGRLCTLPDGTRTFYCIMLDISEQRREREALRLSLERHRLIMDQTTDIIFEWDIIKDTLDFSGNWRKKFGYDPMQSDVSHTIPCSENIHPDDMAAFIKIMRDTRAGVPYSETEFRIRDMMGVYTWCRIRATTQYAQGRAVKAIGVIINIDSQKKQQQKLLDRAQRDSLTGLFNKAATKEQVDTFLAQGRSGVLMILDLDDFKKVNDRLGHLYGDAALSEVARTLRSRLRTSDVVGRIGGDEFLAYLPEVTTQKAHELARMLIQCLEQLRVGADQRPISCSIGCARYPQDGADFYTLYRLADCALYHAKHRGKRQYALYDMEYMHEEWPNDIVRTAVGTAIESDLMSVNVQLAQYCFRMLYDAMDVTSAVQQLLEIIGKTCDVSRAYIFENDASGQTCSNTFEWCAPGISAEIGNLQNVAYADFPGFLEAYDENGIYYCRDVYNVEPELSAFLARQRIRSVLHCAIFDEGEMKGFVGFDECRENRAWTQEQINSLKLVSNVLSVFLLKQRLKERLEGIHTEEKR